MKTSFSRRNNETANLIPPSTATAIEQLQRVADWTKNSHALPPSMGRKTAKQFENEDFEEKSQLIVEAVRMLDTRDKQIRSKPTTARQTADLLKDDADISVDEDHQKRVARLYVKDFGEKMKKKTYDPIPIQTMLTSFPLLKGRKGVAQNKNVFNLTNQTEIGPVVEPESWRFKASRSMKFTVKPFPSQGSDKRGAGSIAGSDDKWTLKPENDRDWWKWKLKQGFLQNDELLQKLVSQRHTLEATFKPVERIKTKQKPVSRNASLTPFPSNQNSSRHVTVQIPFQSKLLRSQNVESSSRGLENPKTREPIPNFYQPPKSFAIATLVNTSEEQNQQGQHKPVSLRQDPYLTKLLAGSQMFKPDAMLDVHQPSRRHEFTQQNINNAENVNRKISLESITDSDDDFAARKFFTPDIKVLYERLSENMEHMPTKDKDPKLSSREPSDGYVNLPILLATGRFSRFNKLPSVKTLAEQSKGSRKNGMVAKVRTTSRFTSNKFVNKIGNEFTKRPQSSSARIEDLPTNEWAKKVMEKVKKQGSIIEERSESGNLTVTTLDNNEFGGQPDNLSFLQRHSNTMKPIDKEMNMLYHDILMSKWKKDWHERDTAARKHTIAKLKRGDKAVPSKKLLFDERKDLTSDKPRGLDIWLENIREKAKREKLISPHNSKDQSQSARRQGAPPLVKTFENTSFSVSKEL